jgi:hypothetical protein
MSLLESFKRLFSGGSGPSAIHKRGMAKAKRENWDGAISDYTAVLDSSHASEELKAMARFNRALAYSKQGAHDAAETDLRAVLEMNGAPANIATAAKEKLARWEKRRGMQE